MGCRDWSQAGQGHGSIYVVWSRIREVLGFKGTTLLAGSQASALGPWTDLQS